MQKLGVETGKKEIVTLDDIARRAGVSQPTVSRALADSPLISAKTKARIQLIADEAGYQVNLIARSLKTKSTRTLGLVVPEVSNPYFPKLIQCFADASRAAGYNLQLQLSGAYQEAEASCLGYLREARVDGILIVTSQGGLPAKAQAEALLNAGVPVVVLGWVDECERLDVVMADDAIGGRALARHLIEAGHTRIAIVGAALHRGPYDRLVGFLDGLAEAGLDAERTVCFQAASDADVERAVESWLTMSERPTALFAYRDVLAAVLLKHLSDRGLSVPADVTVVGFDNIDLATYVTPRLTTVDLSVEALASAAVKQILARINERPMEAAPSRQILGTRLVVRQSSGPPPLQSSLMPWQRTTA
ncbi:MAG: LacI family DNA-binding transcriptional regulator [Fimbriimonas sp.]|nr:LacI family DNA-binding transcriptional regulator [Fimbriimonas sp.]